MKVKKLICELKKLPQNAELMYVYDGCARGSVDLVYEAKSGFVLLLDESDANCIYDEKDKKK